MKRRHSTAGFTLLELMTTMAIAGILMSIAIPSFRYVTTSNRVASEVNALLGDMQFARAEAIKEGNPVSVCVANAGETDCQTGTPPWTGGWIVFSDPNSTGSPANALAILRKRPPFTSDNSPDSFASTVSLVSFNREGFASGLAGTTLFTLHDPTVSQNFTRCLALQATGYLIVVTPGNQGCA